MGGKAKGRQEEVKLQKQQLNIQRARRQQEWGQVQKGGDSSRSAGQILP